MANPVRTRLPPISTTLVIQFTHLEMARDQSGQEECFAHGVGELRRRLGLIQPKRQITASEIARSGAAALLRELCEHCPFAGCPMKAL